MEEIDGWRETHKSIWQLSLTTIIRNKILTEKKKKNLHKVFGKIVWLNLYLDKSLY